MLSDEQFIPLYETLGPTELAKKTGTSVRAVFQRRQRIESKTGEKIIAPPKRAERRSLPQYPQRACFDIEDGVVLIASDAHYWPNYISTAHRAFCLACLKLKPRVVVMNGDVCDFGSISRHPPIGWETQPTVVDEIEAAKTRLDEIRDVAVNAKLVWTLGNHDARFETKLATVAPEYAKIHGVHLQDHFPEWTPAWSCWINDDVVIKHRFKGGVHATHNNTLAAGKTMVTGHLHSLKVTPYSDYNGTRWGVDTGTLAEPSWPQFRDYTEDNPLNWRSGFVVLTFRNGTLLQPEMMRVISDNEVDFRGRVWRV